MAGSYEHVTNAKGKLANPDNWYVDNLGDAYETIEEMYGMIWWLASHRIDGDSPAAMVKEAQRNYREGLEASPGIEPEP